ncbi:MAG: pseudoazurin [Rhizobiaceae bacterium]
MRIAITVPAILAVILSAATVQAEEFEVKMLNKGEKGTMVFEPDLVMAQPGDTVRFVPTDKGHNVESIDGMLPEGVEAFKSKPNDEFVLTLGAEGAYGVKCTPHYGLGMVALVVAGEPVNLEEAMEVKQKGKAKKRFKEIFEAYEAQ